jgi:hypothetical protein
MHIEIIMPNFEYQNHEKEIYSYSLDYSYSKIKETAVKQPYMKETDLDRPYFKECM